MNKTEFAKLADWIKTCFPREDLLPNKAALAIWYEELKDLDFNTALAAVRKHTQTSKWAPTIADIRSLAAEITTAEPGGADWGEGWKKVNKAIGRYGYMQEADALESLDDITRATVKRLGWKSLCRSDNPAADRANFRKVYEQIAHRKLEETKLSPSLIEQIEATRRELVTDESKRLFIPHT